MNGALLPNRVDVARSSSIMAGSLVVEGYRSALRDRLDVAARGPGVELPRAADLLLRIGDHFVPLRDPADGARQGEDGREQAARNAQRALHDAGVEIDVGIELALDEIVVFERDLLQRHRQLEQPIVVQAQILEYLVAGFAHELRPRVVILVYPMPEAHELNAGV